MPQASKKPCAVKTCPELTTARFCEKHAREHWKRVNATNKRPSARRRGYDGNWERLRRMYLQHHPLCEDCEAQGRTTAAVLVHHIQEVGQHPELRLDWDNLRALCRDCHERAHGYDRRTKGFLGVDVEEVRKNTPARR